MASTSTNLWVLLGLGIAGVLLVAQKLKRAIKKDFGAFVERLELLPPPPPPPPKAPHPLSGLTFAVADIFDISGHVTGFGHPDWARTHEPAESTSPVVLRLVDEGAACVGKTVIDEFAYGISGQNKHFGMPTNPIAPERVPGGCCSGSAVAVASGLVDFSLGVDGIGGVRIPAGFCGVLGFRPSHATVSNVGVIPVSPSLDTIGCFAKDPSVLHRVGHVLLRLPYADKRQPRRIMIADDCFQLLNISTTKMIQVVVKSTEKLFGRQLLTHVNLGDYMAPKISSLKQLQNGSIKDDAKIPKLSSLSSAMRLLHKLEFQTNHGEWINSVKPAIEAFIPTETTSEATATSVAYFQSIRSETRSAINALLKDDGILVLPTALGPPKMNSKEILSDDYQVRALALSSITSMSGCCQVTVPIGFHEKCPVSVSFIARHGGDRFLLDTIQTMYAILQEQADIAMKPNTSSTISKEESAEIAKVKGNNAYKDKQWQKAIILYTEAIKLNGDNATYYSNRAAAYLEMGSYLQAEADCSTAISLDKKSIKAYLRRGTAREMLGYSKEAYEDFRYALVLEPTNKAATIAVNRLKRII